jgi:inosine-uridine nucleoside N-ribohydrolase
MRQRFSLMQNLANVTVVPLDVTYKILIDTPDMREMIRQFKSPISQNMWWISRGSMWISIGLKSERWDVSSTIHLVIAYLLDRRILKLSKKDMLQIETEGYSHG